ncbi:aspartoacylase [Flavobacteriales bacterium 33_180_T64]|nr:aspartoacylase [Flavobacteriales bacterium 33_180_T64]
MTQVYSKALDKTISTARIIGRLEGKTKGPSIVFFGGIHGNETAGVFALKEVFDQLSSINIQGNAIAVSGNLKALETNQRYIDSDLNRLWTHSNLEAIETSDATNCEQKEQNELFQILKDIISSNTGPFYFIDLHTTSSKTLPFITINDALINRKFSYLFPVPIVLGIEEYLNGPLLSYINELGYVSLGFESGQHNDKDAISNSISFIHLALAHSKVLKPESIAGLPIYHNQLKGQSRGLDKIYEVVYMHEIRNGDAFQMNLGFESFESINKGTFLAQNNGIKINSKYSAKLFMPLYQKKGREGFFLIREIKPFFLRLSETLRTYNVDKLLVILPGISWDNKKKHVLKVNLKVPVSFAKSFFHLLGYRNKYVNSTHIKLFNREKIAKVNMYKNEFWFKK